jgi:hypothetical protein
VKRISRNLIPILVLALVITGLGAFAAMASGRDLQRPDLNSSGIWASSNPDGMVGRFNKAASTLEFGIYPGQTPPSNVDVLQDGNVAIAVNRVDNRLYPINSLLAKPMLERFLQLPDAAEYGLRGGTVAVLNTGTGQVRATRTDGIESGLDLTPLDKVNRPLAELGPATKAALTIGVDGTIYAVNTSGKVLWLKPAEGGGFEAVQTTTLPFSNISKLSLTVVGEKLVVFDPDNGILYLPDGKQATLPAERVVLQQPSADADSVLVATSTKLLRVSFEGEVKELFSGASGTPAAPASVSGCDFSAWSGDPGKVVRVCGETVDDRTVAKHAEYGQELRSPAFRVNWGLVILNDLATGRIYDWDLNKNLDDWVQHAPNEEPTPPDESVNVKQVEDAEPTAENDKWGVRPGRTATLHLLDNDNDPNGNSLSIIAVTQPTKGASVAIAPDGQSVLYQQPADGESDHFDYTITNGVKTAKAKVEVEARSADQSKVNEAPVLRQNYQPRTYSIGSDSTLALAVASDWRDYDGDPVTVQEATEESEEGTDDVPVTSDGQVEFQTGREQRDRKTQVTYTVSDGKATGEGSVALKVLSVNDMSGAPAVAQPDVRRGVVGEEVSLLPLANDIPGVDPANPQTKMTLAADVEGLSGLEVTTDRDSGRVTIVAEKPGSYTLYYALGFGTAPTAAAGTIRVDIEKKLADDLPVAVPDEAVLRGTTPVTIDVLKNDADHLGQMLSVVSAIPDDPNLLRATVTEKRWVRIEAVNTKLNGPQIVRYQITNGDGRLVEGIITVTQLPEVTVDEPLLRADRATVRGGDSVLVPVLENDTTRGGSSLQLVSNVLSQPVPGMLQIIDPAAKTGESPDLGQATVVGQQVRYIAPATVTQARELRVEYSAQATTGSIGQSVLYISLKPSQSEDAEANRPPSPKTIEQRVVAGEQTTIRIPTSGQDPDGDLTTVVAIGKAPSKGRVISFSPNAIIYEAFPDDSATGTDTFEYVIADQFGAQGTGQIRVGVIQPGYTQAPAACDDQITAEPNALVTVDVIDNDFIAEDDVATVELVDKEDESRAKVIDGRYIQLVAPPADADPVQVQYALKGNGDGESVATVSLKGQEGFLNPPSTEDKVAEAIDDERAAVDVLENAYDPDSDITKIKVTVPNATEEQAVEVENGVVSVNMATNPQVLSYIAADDRGASTSGLIFVPAKDDGLPYAVGEIEIPMNSSLNVNLATYVKTPRPEHTVKIAPLQSASATPAQLLIEADSDSGFKLTATDDYVGPGAVSLRVTDGEGLADPNGKAATVTIPVQVGPVTPVLRCPKEAQVVRQGSEKDLDISSLCHVWPEGMENVKFTAEWREPLAEVTPTVVGGTTLHLVASGAAQPRAQGVLSIGVVDMEAVPQDLKVVVEESAKPTMASIAMEVRSGTKVSQRLKLRSSIVSGRQDTVVGCVPTNALAEGSPCDFSGDTWTIQAGNAGDENPLSGKLTYRLTASDIADTSQADRHVSTTITITVYDRPAAPSPPTMVGEVQSHAITLKWDVPASHGASIDRYELQRLENGDPVKTITCMSTTCTDTGMANRKEDYQYRVRAHNRADWSDYSGIGKGNADRLPTAVQGFYADTQRDGEITLHWKQLVGGSEFSAVESYTIMWPGKNASAASGATSIVLKDLKNVEQTFVICAENSAGRGACTETKGWPTGAPKSFKVSKVDPANLNADQTAVTVSWSQSAPNGEGPVTYTFSDNGTVVSGCFKITAQQCTFNVDLNGSTHNFSVQALNAPEYYTTTKAMKEWIAQGTPPRPPVPDADPTGVNKQVQVTGTVPDSRGPDGTAYVKIYSNGSLQETQTVNARGGSYSHTVTAGNNGATAQISVKLCYENPVGEEHCGPESSSRSVVPFGPLSLEDVQVHADGKHLIAKVDADANGYTAQLQLTASGCSTASDSGAGNLSATLDCDLGAWGAYKQFTATLSTSSNPARATKTSHGDGTTPIPPAFDLPVITATRSGNAVTVTATGDAKGYKAKLVITGDCGTASSGITTSSNISVTLPCTLPWDDDYTFTATISNEEPGADSYRLAKSASTPLHIPPQPVPAVQVSKGAANSIPSCPSGCNWVSIKTMNTPSGSYHCELWYLGPNVPNIGKEWEDDLTGDQTVTPKTFGYAGDTVEVRCNFGSPWGTKTHSITW